MLIVTKNGNELVKVEPEKIPSSPIFFVIGEESYSKKQDNKDCLVVSAVLGSESLEETSLFFESKTIRQFLAPSDTEITVITVTIEKVFSPKKKVNLFFANLCSIESESEIYINITKFWLSTKDQEIKCNTVCSSSLTIFEKTDSLSKYSNIVKELIAKI